MPRGRPSIPTLIEHGSDLLRQYVETDTRRTTLLRDIARVVVNIRSQTLNPKDGQPDWAGQSQPYRDSVRQMYDGAGIPTDGASNVQAALRYHIGEVLREVASPAALTKAGLATKGPKDRARERAHAAQAQGTDTDTDTDDPEDLIRDAILRVQQALGLPTPEDPSILMVLCLTLEHQTQTLRDTLQQQATEQVLQAA